MFLKVKIDNKTLIINLGSDLSQASSLVEMFEKNAVVVEESYSHVGVVKWKLELHRRTTIRSKWNVEFSWDAINRTYEVY